jgi:hypothetical protein
MYPIMGGGDVDTWDNCMYVHCITSCNIIIIVVTHL